MKKEIIALQCEEYYRRIWGIWPSSTGASDAGEQWELSQAIIIKTTPIIALCSEKNKVCCFFFFLHCVRLYCELSLEKLHEIHLPICPLSPKSPTNPRGEQP